MPITGAHALFHTPEPEAMRHVLSDAFGWDSIDVGDGWLIFALPPGEIAVHPNEYPRHEMSFFCDDLATTVADLAAKGVEFRGEPVDEGLRHRRHHGPPRRRRGVAVRTTSRNDRVTELRDSR